jgi:signal transduction histidine kinase
MAKKAGKSFADQFDNEDVLFVFRKHPIVMRRGIIYSSLALLAGTFPALIRPEYSWFFGGLAAGFVLCVLVFFPYWMSWYYSVFIVTNQRLIQVTQKGFFNRSIVSLGLDQIQMINYEVAGLQETLLGYGTISIQTYVGSLTLHEIHKPSHIQQEMLSVLKEMGITANNPMASEQAA